MESNASFREKLCSLIDLNTFLQNCSFFTLLSSSNRTQLHLQGAQLQQALLDVQGSVEFAERLLTCGSDAEILSVKGVTLRRLTSLAESSYDAHPATVAPDDGSSISFMPRELAGEVEGYPVVGLINSKTVDLNKCTIEGEGKLLLNAKMFYFFIHVLNGCLFYSVMFLFHGSSYRQAGGTVVGIWGRGLDHLEQLKTIVTFLGALTQRKFL